jgi:hypothetical protein
LTIVLFIFLKARGSHWSKRVPLGQKKKNLKQFFFNFLNPMEKRKKEKGFLKWWPSGIIEKVMKK